MARLSCAIVLVVLGVLVSMGADDPEPKRQSISIDTLREVDVIGELGIPLGQAAEITATIVSGESLRRKAYASAYLLQVESVDGVALDQPAILTFVIPGFADVDLASDHFSLHKLKTGRNARSLDSAEIKELEKDYVGRKVRLAAYESGGFSGMPNNPLKYHIGTWQDRRFHFRSHLIVLKERELTQPK